jgi:predicted PurR-regulated permease PerM
MSGRSPSPVLFVLAVFYTIYFMRSILLPIILALLLSYLLRPIVRGLAQLKIPLPVSAAFILIGLLALVSYGVSALATPRGGMASESTGRFGRTAIQAPAVKKIDGASDPRRPAKSRNWPQPMRKLKPWK